MIYSIQILRGIAALMVVLFHYNVGRGTLAGDYPYLADIFSNGYAGVNLFFIISGFIMFAVSRRNNNPVDFILKRILRIIPLYWLLLLTHNGLQSILNPDTYQSMLFIPLGLRSAPFMGYAAYTPGWTLNYEMFFYLVFCVGMCFGRYKYQFIFTIFAILHILFCISAQLLPPDSFTTKLIPRSIHSPYLAMMLNPMVLLFGVGILLGYLYEKCKQLNDRWMLAVFGMFVSVWILFWNDLVQFDRHGIHTTIFCAMLFVTIVSLERFIARSATALKMLRPLVFLGTISYSMYLIHMLLVYKPFFERSLPHLVNMAVILVLTLLLSWLSYEIIEKRFTGFLRAHTENLSAWIYQLLHRVKYRLLPVRIRS